jgi:hypothetical protein
MRRQPKRVSKRAALLRAPFKFFLEHAGFATPPGKAACALSLAKAERDADKAGIEFVTMPDDSPDASFVEMWSEQEQEDWNKCDHECVGVVAMLPCPDHGTDCKHAKHLASLWGIWDADSAYLRVVRAELASEALGEIEP